MVKNSGFIYYCPIADLTGGYVERKRIAAEMTAGVARAENNFKIAQFEEKSRGCMQAEQNDADYDLLVLKNRDKTLMDEVIILFFLELFVCHFMSNIVTLLTFRSFS
ncbi:hypothetical protein [Pseudoalteromonas sp. SWXJ133]|uniref:hypothetical protein n=1 Tax=Pseudoalteromonas sp. SWXJ133 TaxID=2792069 RepID=UPI001E3FED02|nr:hypothetical protein [Pseudoalteromonas sp. SWXJ133]